MTEFEQGVLMAASVLNSLFDQPTAAANVINELGCGGVDCSEMDDFDKTNLRLISADCSFLNLKGLGE